MAHLIVRLGGIITLPKVFDMVLAAIDAAGGRATPCNRPPIQALMLSGVIRFDGPGPAELACLEVLQGLGLDYVVEHYRDGMRVVCWRYCHEERQEYFTSQRERIPPLTYSRSVIAHYTDETEETTR